MSNTSKTDANTFSTYLGFAKKAPVILVVKREVCAEIEGELAAITAQLHIKSEFISSRQCPDHNGKWKRGNCLQCELERLKAELAECEKDARGKVYKMCTDHEVLNSMWPIMIVKNATLPIEVCPVCKAVTNAEAPK